MTGFALIVLFIAAQSYITLSYISSSEALVKQTISRDFNNSAVITRMAILGQELRRYEKEYFLYIGNSEKRKGYEKEWTDAYQQLQRTLVNARNNNAGDWSQPDVLEFGKWQAALEDYHRGFTLIAQNTDSGLVKSTLEANKMIQEGKNRFKVLLTGTAEYTEKRLSEAKRSESEIYSNFSLINKIVLSASAAGILLSALLMLVIPAAISRPISALTRAARLMSKGDLSQQVPVTSGSEFRDLAETLERMRISQKTLMERYASKNRA